MTALPTGNTVVSKIAHDACLEAPPLETGAWWEDMPADFARRDEGFELAPLDRLRVNATAAIDVVIRSFAATSMVALAAPIGFTPGALRNDRKDRDLYERLALTRDPSRFFEAPTEQPAVRVRKTRSKTFRPAEGTVESLRFESGYKPLNPRMRKGFSDRSRNHYAHVRWFRHRNGPRPTIVFIHGFGAEKYALNQWFFSIPWFYEHLGLDVALFNMPFHGRRQHAMSPFSGHGFFAGGLSHINESFGQAVHDFRAMLDYFEHTRGVTDVGVTGVSLGGFTSALLAAVEPRLRFAIPNVPVVSLADIILEWQPMGATMQAILKLTGLTVTDARRMLSVSCPLTYEPLLPRERLMVIGGVGDRLAPPKHSRLLWEHWNRCRLHWFPGGHVLHLDRANYLREVARFLELIGFVESRR